MINPEPAITISDVSKVFNNGVVALKDVNLKVNREDFVSLVGPSGCGKSTILRIIAGLSESSGGTIEWADRTLKQQIAFVFQDPALMPWNTVKNNIRLPLKLMGISKRMADTSIAKTLELVGLEKFANAYPRQLSGGMKMRVSIARAIVTEPRVLLMDEPFGALDDITRTNLNDELLSLWNHQRQTIIFVTHNIYEAVYLSKRVVVMGANPGRASAEITIDEPLPRTESFRTSERYLNYCQQVYAALSEAMDPQSQESPRQFFSV
ncbi:ABC transporter ATP-binding protein [Oscillatoria sp. HE19RPO]|uniref:ABC transporter ATP-binding protein n=1 Tax=Oscillatoria sp. HE19RPO TaxID=2954806 RepID=UPI0020C5AA99|nr:ABC transporter ATP-binding protein [Oscillatoria sp. HE19RPO]